MLNTMKLCLALLLLLNAGAAWAGEATEAEALPPAVQSLIDKATQDVAKERAKYDAAAKKLTDKLAADLKKEVEKATKAGNLKLALAVQAQLDEVAKGEVVAKVDGQAKSADLLGDGNVGGEIKVIGKAFSFRGNRMTFNKDGTVANPWGEAWNWSQAKGKLIVDPVGSANKTQFVFDLLTQGRLTGNRGGEEITWTEISPP
jgi:hypothetical protein